MVDENPAGVFVGSDEVLQISIVPSTISTLTESLFENIYDVFDEIKNEANAMWTKQICHYSTSVTDTCIQVEFASGNERGLYELVSQKYKQKLESMCIPLTLSFYQDDEIEHKTVIENIWNQSLTVVCHSSDENPMNVSII